MRVAVIGDQELMRKLDMLAKQSERNKIVRPAVREAAAAVSKKAKSLVAVDSKLLKDSIGIRTKTKGGSAFAVVGPRRKWGAAVWRGSTNYGEGGYAYSLPTKYAHLVEFGTKPGTRIVKYSKRNRNGSAIQHPGTPPRPFMRPAWNGTNARGIMQRRIEHELRKQAQGRVGKSFANKSSVSALRKLGK